VSRGRLSLGREPHIPTRTRQLVTPGEIRLASTAARAGAESAAVRSWIFRHRLRLRAIYGPRPLPGPQPAARAPARLWSGLLPGECARRGADFLLRPPGRPAA